VNILNWYTPPGPPFPTPPDLVIHHINIVSSVNGQVPGLKGLATTGFACGTYSTPRCPQPPWLPTNTGENNALQIIIESTQRATQPNPPPQIINNGARILP